MRIPDNPFQSPSCVSDSFNTENAPSNAVLWRAYLIAPAVAPIVFVLLLFVVAIVASLLGIDVNPASFLVLPAVALSVGFVVCYAVAGAIGMPIAVYLRNRRMLNGYTIHGAALSWAVFFSVVMALSVFRVATDELPSVIVYVICGVTPPVLLSATVFSLLIRDRNRSQVSGCAGMKPGWNRE